MAQSWPWVSQIAVKKKKKKKKKKQKYLDQNEKSSAATQFQVRRRFNRFSTTNNQQGELQNKQHHQQDQQSSITENQNEVTNRITKPFEKDSEIGNILYQLVKEQSAPSIDIEVFDGNPLHYTYFFHEKLLVNTKRNP